MARQERDILERAVRAVSEQAAAARELEISRQAVADRLRRYERKGA